MCFSILFIYKVNVIGTNQLDIEFFRILYQLFVSNLLRSGKWPPSARLPAPPCPSAPAAADGSPRPQGGVVFLHNSVKKYVEPKGAAGISNNPQKASGRNPQKASARNK